MEQWCDIPGYEGAYQVSDQGRVRSLDRRVRLVTRQAGETTRLAKGRVLRPGPSSTGHLSVVLGRGNTRQVHSLVLLVFQGPCPAGHECLHGDGNPANNKLSNLRYGTRSENNTDITRQDRRQLSLAQVRYIKERAKTGFAYGERYQLALRLGVNPGTIYNILSGKHYASVS